jgi:cytochrome P450
MSAPNADGTRDGEPSATTEGERGAAEAWDEAGHEAEAKAGAGTETTPELPPETPPGPDGLPLVGNAHSLVRDPEAFFEELSGYGDVVGYSIPRLQFCAVLHPELIERVLLTDVERFGKYGFEDLGGEFASEGLLLTEGEQWRRQREAVQTAFTVDRVGSYADAMTRYADDLVAGWDDGQEVRLDEAFADLTMQVLAHSLFDIDLDGEAAAIVTEFAATLNDRGSLDGLSAFLPTWVPTPENRRYRRILSEFREFVDALIDERRGRVDEYDDVLSILLTAADDEGRTMSDVELRDQMATFLFAGHETTSLALTFAVLQVAAREDVRERLDEEYATVLGGDPPGLEDVTELAYTDRVIQETLRRYPPAFVTFREAREEVELGGYRIPEGTKLTLPQFHVHTDERWYDDPERFDPDRWTDGLEASLPDFAYFPFGGGPRHCIGMRFAMLELRTVLPTVLQRVGFDLLSSPDPDLDMAVTLRPAEPVRARVRKR